MSFIFFLFFLIISVAAVILLFVLGIIRTILGFGRKRNTFQNEDSFNRRKSRNPFKKTEEKPKVFGEKEGEYVDYEDIS